MEDQEERATQELEAQVLSINNICRLCAGQNEKLISIFGEEGITHDLSTKINLYLPIKVVEADELPLMCCWECATTIITWHELVLATAETDRKFRSCQFIPDPDKTLAKGMIFDIGTSTVAIGEHSGGIGSDSLSISLNAFCQTDPGPPPLIRISNDKIKVEKIKPQTNKRKPELLHYYPTPEVTPGPLETYIADIEQHFIVTTNTDDLPEENQEAMNPKTGETTANVSDENEEDNDVDHQTEDDILDEDEAAIAKDEKEDWDETVKSYFPCQYCNAIFIYKKDVLNHVQEDHPGNEPFEPVSALIPEQKNVKREKRKNNKIDQELINAAKVVVDGRIYYNCKECGKSLHSPYTYVWHMRIHTGERPFVCDLCGKQFRVSQGLVRHLRETHQGIKKFPCDICGRMFATRRNVEEHRRIHTNERPYICDLCGKSFKQKASLFVHKRSHKNYFPFKCTYCNQGFRTKPPLMVHITRHTGEKPYKCDVCGRCFRIKYELKRHRLIHSDEKPFSCMLCGLSFRQKRYLRNHTKSNHHSSAASS